MLSASALQVNPTGAGVQTPVVGKVSPSCQNGVAGYSGGGPAVSFLPSYARRNSASWMPVIWSITLPVLASM